MGGARPQPPRFRCSDVFGVSHLCSEPGVCFRGVGRTSPAAVGCGRSTGAVPPGVGTPPFSPLPTPPPPGGAAGAPVPLLPGTASATDIPKNHCPPPLPFPPSLPPAGDAPRQVRPRSPPVAAGTAAVAVPGAPHPAPPPRALTAAAAAAAARTRSSPRPRRAAGSGGRGEPRARPPTA